MKKVIYLLACILVLGSCQKETLWLYEVNTETIKLSEIDKEAVKKDLEFISFVHMDLFGKPIDSEELTQAVKCYAANGDKAMITDRLIRSYLNKSTLVVPTQTQLSIDPESFILETYKKFYHRSPSELELWYLKNYISTNTSVTPVMIYYAFLTSDEYKRF
jgi:hypothetical protein